MDDRIQTVVVLIAANPAACLAELSAAAGISVSRLQHIFTAGGLSLRSVARGEVMGRAASLLETSALSVKEIQISVGFGTASSFCRAFKRHYGVSPTMFRTRTEKTTLDHQLDLT